MLLHLGAQHKVILKIICQKMIFHLTVLFRVLFFSLDTPDIMAFVLFFTDADSEKLLERFSVDLKTFCIHPTIY